MSLSLWELAATPLSQGQMAEAAEETPGSTAEARADLEFQKWLGSELRKRKLAKPQFLRDATNGDYLNAAIQTLYESWRAEHAPG